MSHLIVVVSEHVYARSMACGVEIQATTLVLKDRTVWVWRLGASGYQELGQFAQIFCAVGVVI